MNRYRKIILPIYTALVVVFYLNFFQDLAWFTIPVTVPVFLKRLVVAGILASGFFVVAMDFARKFFPIKISFFVLLVVGLVFWQTAPAGSVKAVLQEVKTRITVTPVHPIFPMVDLVAKAAVVYDLETNQAIFTKAADQALPIASLTKLMTAWVVADWLPSSTRVNFREEWWSSRALADYMLLTSDNQAAEALALAASLARGQDFVTEMNQRAKVLNLEQTFFANSTGLDLDDGVPGATSSASDLVRLLTYLFNQRYDLFGATKNNQLALSPLNGKVYLAKNTNELISQLTDPLVSKTGLTDTAGGNLIVSFDRGFNQPVIVVVLGSSETGRFADVTELINRAKQYYDH